MSAGGVFKIWAGTPYNKNSTTGKYWNIMNPVYKQAIIDTINCAYTKGCINSYAFEFFQILLMHLNSYQNSNNTNNFTIDANVIYNNINTIVAYVKNIYQNLPANVKSQILYSINCILNTCLSPSQVQQLFKTMGSVFQMYIQPYINSGMVIDSAYYKCMQHASDQSVCNNFLQNAPTIFNMENGGGY
jgi:hypothetical protein